MRSYFGDFKLWILLFLLVRLININAPILDSHNWRQADGYSIARNFLTVDANPLYPRIDHAGTRTGITGSEAPVMNYCVFLLYKLFGVNWWPGRLLNLFVTSLGCWFFYQTVARFMHRKAALAAGLFLLASIWFSHGRKFMPDTFSASLILMGVFFGWQYLKAQKGWSSLLLFGLFCSLGLLSKLPAFVATALLAPALFDRQIATTRKLILLLASALVLMPVLGWYFYWAPHLTETYGYHYFYMGSSLSESIHYLTSEWPKTLRRFYNDSLHLVGFGLFLVGLFFLAKTRNRIIGIATAGGIGLLACLMLAGGETFVHHTYYIMPFAPVMALVAGFAVNQIPIGWIRWVLILAVIIESPANQIHELRIKDSLTYRLEVENVIEPFAEPADLIATNTDGNPSTLYLANRKGWAISKRHVDNQGWYPTLHKQGCELIVWDKHQSAAPTQIPHFTIAHEDEHFVLYRRN